MTSKPITLVDVKEPNNIFQERNEEWRKIFSKMLKKANANARLRELFLPIVEDFQARLDEYPHIRPVRFSLKGNCVICGYILTRSFPEDFPKEWKFCCSCREFALLISIGLQKANSPLFKKIQKKITLVK